MCANAQTKCWLLGTIVLFWAFLSEQIDKKKACVVATHYLTPPPWIYRSFYHAGN